MKAHCVIFQVKSVMMEKSDWVSCIKPHIQSSGLTLEPLVLMPAVPDVPAAAPCLLGIFPIFQPHDLSVLTTFGVTAAVNGTRMKMKDLWIAYANASCVHMPVQSARSNKSQSLYPHKCRETVRENWEKRGK